MFDEPPEPEVAELAQLIEAILAAPTVENADLQVPNDRARVAFVIADGLLTERAKYRSGRRLFDRLRDVLLGGRRLKTIKGQGQREP